MEDRIPVLLLKTKSTPRDGYEDYFNALENGKYQSTFVPVLEHRFRQDSLQNIRNFISHGEFGLPEKTDQAMPKYGGIIFTSQRAVEAFSHVVNAIREESGKQDILSGVPFYVVGPATARGLRALELNCPIVGDETGNGEALASFMLEHYNALWKSKPDTSKPALLFLVGEQRRDVIPKMLQTDTLSSGKKIRVVELVVYETDEMQSFRSDFTSLWSKNAAIGHQLQWVVVFSPTGCNAMLQSLGLIDQENGKFKKDSKGKTRPFIATIGPTTRDFLRRQFEFEPDVCAKKPSPEGVGSVIADFMANRN